MKQIPAKAVTNKRAKKPSEASSSLKHASSDSRYYAVVGNPNSGKTTLFNALTGLKQKVGNYPGVTVEKKLGHFTGHHGEKIFLIDLPGSYSLQAHSPDEEITRDVLLGLQKETAPPERLLCVLDASHLERNLYFLSQVLELGLPTIVALNMTDLAEKQGVAINVEKLSKTLGVPVIAVQATRSESLLPLKIGLSRADLPRGHWDEELNPMWDRAIDAITATWPRQTPLPEEGSDNILRVHSQLLLSHQAPTQANFLPAETSEALLGQLQAQRSRLDQELPGWKDHLVAARYAQIGEICKKAQGRMSLNKDRLTQRLDDILTHPCWGWVIFLGMMAFIFISIFTIADYPMKAIDAGFDQLADWLKTVMPSGDLRDLLTGGVIAGMGSVIVFLPQILILFFFIGLLEDSGYMARAAFLMDRIMSKVGLHGKSFIPLLSSYACAIPGIMATRTIESPRDRLVTILVAPLMSCSARLPVYTLMIATLFPTGSISLWQKGFLMVGLYLLGTVGALFFAWLFKKTILRGETPIFLMELPPYRAPSLPQIGTQMLQRAMLFLKRAGTVILGISILLWFLTAFPKRHQPENTSAAEISTLEQSYAGHIGHFIEPAIRPLGFDWKIGIGLLSAQAAREVFVSTMSIVYHVEQSDDDDSTPLSTKMQKIERPDGSLFYTPLTCLSILVFFVFSMQCFSTLAVVRRETNTWKWPLFQFCYMTATAYFLSLLLYQGGHLLGFH